MLKDGTDVHGQRLTLGSGSKKAKGYLFLHSMNWYDVIQATWGNCQVPQRYLKRHLMFANVSSSIFSLSSQGVWNKWWHAYAHILQRDSSKVLAGFLLWCVDWLTCGLQHTCTFSTCETLRLEVRMCGKGMTLALQPQIINGSCFLSNIIKHTASAWDPLFSFL